MKTMKEKVDYTDGTAAAPQTADLGAGDLAGGGNIDKIRDILFGVQMRDYEKRFIRLEERLLKEAADLREETKRRFDALETYIKQENESLNERIVSEQGARTDSVEEISRNIKDTARGIDKKTAQMDEQSAKNVRDIRQQLLDQSKTLSDEIRKKYDELLATLERESAELRAEKTDRTALAALFTEAALRLNNEFKIPGGE